MSATLFKMGAVLMVVGGVCTFFLATTSDITRDPIAEARRQETLRTLEQLSPPGMANEPDRDSIEVTDARLNRKGKPVKFYRSRDKAGKALAAMYVVTAPDGYAGNIEIMMSVLPGGTLKGIQVVNHKETPGLGDKMVTTDWPKKFEGKNLQNAKWGVKKDGGEFDQFAGATITPRAIVGAVKRGLEYFAENEKTIFDTPPAEEKK